MLFTFPPLPFSFFLLLWDGLEALEDKDCSFCTTAQGKRWRCWKTEGSPGLGRGGAFEKSTVFCVYFFSFGVGNRSSAMRRSFSIGRFLYVCMRVCVCVCVFLSITSLSISTRHIFRISQFFFFLADSSFAPYNTRLAHTDPQHRYSL